MADAIARPVALEDADGRADREQRMGRLMILPTVRDPRLVTVRRGGSLEDDDHRLLGVWAADCAQHVLHHFERARPGDDRPRRAISMGRAWARGEITWTLARTAAFAANTAAREVTGAAREAPHAASQAAAVGHVAAHELGAAATRSRPPGRRLPNASVTTLVAESARARARRPAATQRAVLVRVRLLT
jgi:hypothetical protein